ncbi:phospho-N-acetylmuramoyl-pentapeptide-transferase [Mesotoga sp. H07.pep.5.3]|uniref:phospho-N-acetylmuramoyl-pentapeptide- transferase n=1 Tax=Mesotoga sp. H07.pep.5.3 TaxID=1421003 RepID=UPI000C18BA40|nr:phospho-N-acetylmuramoyl-pentapeptide-transferase [Mesotoga sp. H07.pep.5.3]PIJ63422.1 phospho-N-acetylmuramoyl-pentapeptide-transferase [Mesotoga sp. H07.pep.5.3]
MHREVFTFLLAFLLSVLAMEPLKRYQKRRRIGQYIREEGPDLHNYKTGTPTAAGIVFIPIALAVASIFAFRAEILIVVLAGILFGLIGLVDDISKIVKRNASGLSGKRKLALQLVSAAFIVFLIQLVNPHTHIEIPFLGKIGLGFAYYPISAVIIAGMSNAVNLTDGVDGLAASVYIFSLAPMLALPVWQNGLIAPISGALAGFLWYNWFPASIFMGDTGSLSLGGIMAVIFALDGREGFLIFFGLMFLVEMFSVIIQVFSFKVFGRRVFKMSPIHHHFELSNWKESKIAFRFSLIAFIGAVFGLLSW